MVKTFRADCSGCELDRGAVEVGVEDGAGMHRHRPALAASLRPNRSAPSSFSPSGRTRLHLRRRQPPSYDAPELAAFLRSWIAALIVERILSPRSVSSSGRRSDRRRGRLGRSGRKSHQKEVAKPDQRIGLAKRLGVEDRARGGIESHPELILLNHALSSAPSVYRRPRPYPSCSNLGLLFRSTNRIITMATNSSQLSANSNRSLANSA